MAEYPINKGIGRPVEFKGLKAQYLFIFCGGLLALFVLFVILYMVGVGQWVCIGFGAAVLHPRMADLRAECPVRRTRADEIRGDTEPSPIPYKPAADHPISNGNERKKRNEKYIENNDTGKQISAIGGGARLHHLRKDADITVAFEVELPELYTVTGAVYEAIHGCWCKAIKVLPDFSVVHSRTG